VITIGVEEQKINLRFLELKEAFENNGNKDYKWMETHGMCGRFQHCTCEDALYIMQTLKGGLQQYI
jgi:hypothetical protein